MASVHKVDVTAEFCTPIHFTGRRFHYDAKKMTRLRRSAMGRGTNGTQTWCDVQDRSRSVSKRHERLRAELILALLKTSADQRRFVKKCHEAPQQRSRKSIAAVAAYSKRERRRPSYLKRQRNSGISGRNRHYLHNDRHKHSSQNEIQLISPFHPVNVQCSCHFSGINVLILLVPHSA